MVVRLEDMSRDLEVPGSIPANSGIYSREHGVLKCVRCQQTQERMVEKNYHVALSGFKKQFWDQKTPDVLLQLPSFANFLANLSLV